MKVGDYIWIEWHGKIIEVLLISMADNTITVR